LPLHILNLPEVKNFFLIRKELTPIPRKGRALSPLAVARAAVERYGFYVLIPTLTNMTRIKNRNPGILSAPQQQQNGKC
jgi:hypothetical protein